MARSDSGCMPSASAGRTSAASEQPLASQPASTRASAACSMRRDCTPPAVIRRNEAPAMGADVAVPLAVRSIASDGLAERRGGDPEGPGRARAIGGGEVEQRLLARLAGHAQGVNGLRRGADPGARVVSVLRVDNQGGVGVAVDGHDVVVRRDGVLESPPRPRPRPAGIVPDGDRARARPRARCRDRHRRCKRRARAPRRRRSLRPAGRRSRG